MAKRGKRTSQVPQSYWEAQRQRQRAAFITVVVVFALILAAVIGVVVWQAQRSGPAFAQPAGAAPDGGIVAAGDGPVRVEVYLDFMCPACREFETAVTPTLNELVAQGKIALVWYPVGFLDRLSTTNYSTRAASAAGCAADAGRLKPYGEALFANQPAEGGPGLSDDQLIEIGGTVGLNAPSFAQCVRGQRYAEWVSASNDLAARRGVNATPTVFVAGKEVANPTAPNVLAAVNAAS